MARPGCCSREAEEVIGRLWRSGNGSPIYGQPGDDWSAVLFESCPVEKVKAEVPALYERNSYEIEGERYAAALDTPRGIGSIESGPQLLCGCGLDLSDTSITGCDIRGSAFAASRMVRFRAIRCDLREVDFSNSSLFGASFYHCDMRGAMFEGAELAGVSFSDCDMREASGLASVESMKHTIFSGSPLSRESTVLAALRGALLCDPPLDDFSAEAGADPRGSAPAGMRYGVDG